MREDVSRPRQVDDPEKERCLWSNVVDSQTEWICAHGLARTQQYLLRAVRGRRQIVTEHSLRRKKMKTLFTILATLAATFAMVGLAQADTVSFVKSIQGVDPPPPPWSTGDKVVSLKTDALSLLGKTAKLTGTDTLSHRLTRGLGVLGGTNDDEVDGRESIMITFGCNYCVDYLEVRSLFAGEGPNGEPEECVVDFYLDGSVVYTQPLCGTKDGQVCVTYSAPMVVDRLVFYVPSGQPYTKFSDFALAKLEVTEGVIPVDIVIKPETLNLKSKGLFTAFIDLPKGYGERDVDIKTVECEGAPALKAAMANDGKLILKFDREDLVGISTGDAVELTVTGEFTDGVPFAGSDTITVID